ncbi:MAG: hypothetical protein ING12_00555, partial [Roseomonas sp.]|nr:hypothetical protein [Roseomonas sp.]
MIDSAANSIRVTILDDDAPPPVIAFNTASVGSTPEGNTADGRLLFEILRQGSDLGATATVVFEIAGGTVAADDVYVLGATRLGDGTLAGSLGRYEVGFGVGEFLAEVEVFANRDTTLEPDETAALQLTSVSGFATLSTTGPLSASGIITDDDLPPPPPPVFTLSLAESDFALEGTPPGGGGTIAFRIRRDAGSDLS